MRIRIFFKNIFTLFFNLTLTSFETIYFFQLIDVIRRINFNVYFFEFIFLNIFLNVAFSLIFLVIYIIRNIFYVTRLNCSLL